MTQQAPSSNAIIAPRASVAILDDFFPDLMTGFRVAEYNAYLTRDPDIVVLSSNPDFEGTHKEYVHRYPQFASRIRPYQSTELRFVSLVYLNFLNNAFAFLPDLTAANIPFILTLYPGGGFGLGDRDSDAKLAKVLSSHLCLHVIATQELTASYLRAHRLLPKTDSTLISGGVVNESYFNEPITSRAYYPDKPYFDVAFVAEKYMPFGENKGFPTFCSLISMLQNVREYRWHVVGSFSQADWASDIALPDTITFHGPLTTDGLRAFARGIDVVVSPNRPFVLHPGNFDGFPTGSCIECALEGAAIICSDELNMNRAFVNGVHLTICPPVALAISMELEQLREDPTRIARLARNGEKRIRELYSPDAQILRRLEIIERCRRAAQEKETTPGELLGTMAEPC